MGSFVGAILLKVNLDGVAPLTEVTACVENRLSACDEFTRYSRSSGPRTFFNVQFTGVVLPAAKRARRAHSSLRSHDGKWRELSFALRYS